MNILERDTEIERIVWLKAQHYIYIYVYVYIHIEKNNICLKPDIRDPQVKDLDHGELVLPLG